MPTVETLYISFPRLTYFLDCYIFKRTFPQLRKLWMWNNRLDKKFSPFVSMLEGKVRFFVKPRQPCVTCYGKMSTKMFKIVSRSGSWGVLDELLYSTPYGPKDARRLFLNECTLDTIFFEELNFYHSGPGPVCDSRCTEAVEDILKSPCSTRVKKLCVMICISLSNRDPPSSSRKGISVENCVPTYPAENIFKNFPGLEHLELYVCHQYENCRIPLGKLIENLCLIKSKKLERIVLICTETDNFSAGPLKQLLEMNPQLVFLYFLIRSCTEQSERTKRMAQDTLNTYKKKHPCKVFLVSDINEFGSRSGYPIPDVHYCEMIKSDSTVASLIILEDFDSL
ncbi:uncharacterized protein LOC135125041 isoform X2 [Zophobas morio]|uniref:uncharacterized protein LOC135125041 isoform X2 n=1 Tax=Zophobas morio TaxID=2755281 RepID=UPI00308347DC